MKQLQGVIKIIELVAKWGAVALAVFTALEVLVSELKKIKGVTNAKTEIENE